MFKHVGRVVTCACGCCLAALLAAVLGGVERAGAGTAIAVIVAGLAAVRPDVALLATLGLMPLGAALPLATHLPLPWTDVLVAAGATGWLLRTAVTREQLSQPTFALLALALGVTATVSGLSLVGGEYIATIPPPMGADGWWRAAPDAVGGAEPLRSALRLAGGVAAAVWAAETMRDETRRLSAARLAAVGAAGLAALSIYRLAEIGLRSPAPFDRMLEVLLTVRFAPVIGDPNAQTALFLLVLPTAFAMARSTDTYAAGVAITVAILLGAWLAGSRSALALVPVALGALLLWQRRASGLSRRVLAAVVVTAVLSVSVLAWTGRHGPGAAAWSIRQDFATVTARMIADDPMFGVGLGKYYDQSSEYMPASLRRFYARENAHNQFFQFAGELGVAGLALFVLLAIAALWPGFRRAPADAAPLAIGLGAFLASAVAQHPLLDPQVAATFWMLLGTMKAWTADGAPGKVAARLAVAWTILIALLLPVQTARRSEGIDFSMRVRGARRPTVNGTAARHFTAATRATIYLPADAQVCRMRLRARGLRGEADISLRLDHRPAGALTLARGEWRDTVIRLPAATSGGLRHRRLDLAWAGERYRRAVIDFMPPDCR